MSEVTLQVTSPHFCAGVVLKNGRCVQAAPILYWAVTRSEAHLRDYFRRKMWTVFVVRRAETGRLF